MGDSSGELCHALEMHALTMAASSSLLRTLIDRTEETIPSLPRLEQARTRAALGRLRHVLGIEMRGVIPQTVALAPAVSIVDIGQAAGAVGWVFLILDGTRTHFAVLDHDDVAHLRRLSLVTEAVAELQIWIEGTHEVDSACRAADLCSQVVAVALKEALKHGS